MKGGMETQSAVTDFSDWTGRTQTQHQRIDSLAVAALAATLDREAAPLNGAPLPPGWQWLFFNPVARQSTLGEDGHPRRDLPGSFLPPIPLPRRMWAGSRIRYQAPLVVGTVATRQSRLLTIAWKEGRAGRMCFVTVEHTTSAAGNDCIVEEQDIVFREASVPGAALAAAVAEPPAAPPMPVQWQERVVPDTPLLFRYSALTFNGHRIHYDLPYARDVEGYRGLVVHGPLTATLLQQFAQACRPADRMAGFDFKGVSPLFADEALHLQGWVDPGDSQLMHLRALNATGALAMQASAWWEAE